MLAHKKGDGGQQRASPTKTFVLADIGGTTSRFALFSDRQLGEIAHLRDADFPSFSDALRHFLDRQDARSKVDAALFAVAGPVEGDHCALVNKPWIVDGTALRASFGFSAVRLVNDFEAAAWSLPELTAGDLLAIGGGVSVPNSPMVVVGPGTGLGVAGFVPDADHSRVIASEGGHSTLPSSSSREDAVIGILRQRFGHVSAERALSGQGGFAAGCAFDRAFGRVRGAPL